MPASSSVSLVGGDTSVRNRVVALATRHTLPTIYPYREYVLAGGLMSYGTHYSNEIHKVGISTGRILKGEKAADLPVQQVTKIESRHDVFAAHMSAFDPKTTLACR